MPAPITKSGAITPAPPNNAGRHFEERSPIAAPSLCAVAILLPSAGYERVWERHIEAVSDLGGHRYGRLIRYRSCLRSAYGLIAAGW